MLAWGILPGFQTAIGMAVGLVAGGYGVHENASSVTGFGVAGTMIGR